MTRKRFRGASSWGSKGGGGGGGGAWRRTIGHRSIPLTMNGGYGTLLFSFLLAWTNSLSSVRVDLSRHEAHVTAIRCQWIKCLWNSDINILVMLHFFILAHATGINYILPHLVITVYNKIISRHEKMLKHEGFQPSGNIEWLTCLRYSCIYWLF